MVLCFIIPIIRLSQKVGRCLLYDLLLTSSRVGIKSQKVLIHVLVQFQEGTLVVASVAVVRSTENSTDAVVVLQLVP